VRCLSLREYNQDKSECRTFNFFFKWECEGQTALSLFHNNEQVDKSQVFIMWSARAGSSTMSAECLCVQKHKQDVHFTQVLQVKRFSRVYSDVTLFACHFDLMRWCHGYGLVGFKQRKTWKHLGKNLLLFLIIKHDYSHGLAHNQNEHSRETGLKRAPSLCWFRSKNSFWQELEEGWQWPTRAAATLWPQYLKKQGPL